MKWEFRIYPTDDYTMIMIGTYENKLLSIFDNKKNIKSPFISSSEENEVGKLIDEYFKIQEQIYNIFSFEPNDVVPPLCNCMDLFWYFDEEEKIVNYASKIEDFEIENYYSSSLYTQEFYEKLIYSTDDYTMIMIDTHTDGNKFLAIYDNKKNIKNPFISSSEESTNEEKHYRQ